VTVHVQASATDEPKTRGHIRTLLVASTNSTPGASGGIGISMGRTQRGSALLWTATATGADEGEVQAARVVFGTFFTVGN
jgi:hypothetical protein